MRAQRNFILLSALLLAAVANAQAPLAAKGILGPRFSKEFVPDTMGPGSVTTLVFTIDNSGGPNPVDAMAFSDSLPAGVLLAAPGFVSNTCSGSVTAADGGGSISLAGGKLGVGAICQIIVNVTAGGMVDTTYMNVSGDLTSGAGNSGTASDDLMVDIDRPGFSKSFSPATVPIGGRSTLTFTIDNSASGAFAISLSFNDTLPAGMVVAGPANAITDCDFASAPVLTAVPGGSVISLGIGGVAASNSCTVRVDVIGAAVGSLGNVSDELSHFSAASGTVSDGKAAAVLKVTGVEDLLELSKEFTDDPVAPGGSATLQFTVTNKSRDDAATGITFSDDLEATLTGLTPTLPSTPNPPCGAGSSLSFSFPDLTLTGGSLPPGASCTFSVELAVPGSAAPGAYPNTAGPVSGDIGGASETGNVAGDLLFVVGFPLLTKEFTDDPVAAGDFVTLEFTITNTNPGSALSDIEFIDELTTGSSNGFLPFPVTVTLPPVPDPPCGAGSMLTLISLGIDGQGLELLGGSLAAAGMMGDSCTFSLLVEIPVGLESGIYTNTTEGISAVLADVVGTPTVVGPSASDDVVVLAAPDLAKEFVNDPVIPGGTVTLDFTLEFTQNASGDATDIAFSDDLTALVPAVPGLTAIGVGANTCAGSMVDISTPTLIDFSGGTLVPGAQCAFSVTLSIPAAAPPGPHTNTTSDVTATVGGLSVPNNPGEDDLLITPLVFTKAFSGGPVIAGDTVDMEFTIENLSATDDATSIAFTDSLSAVIPGLAVSGPLPAMPCGLGSSITGTSSLTFSGGEVLAGNPPCVFSVELLVPALTPDDTYANVTSGMSALIGGSPATLPAASADLIVDSTLVDLTKEFTDDPVNPGDQVTLEFTLTNTSASETVTDIAFDDDLDAALAGLQASGATMNTCGGMAISALPTGLFEYAGGTLLPGASCMIVLTVDVPLGPLPGNLFPNTTTGVTGKVGVLDVAGDPASDVLAVDLVDFSKSFDGPAPVAGAAVLTFIIENLDTVNAVNGLAFSDDLDAVISGLTATGLPGNPCGVGSSVTGTSFLALRDAGLAAGGMCSFEVTVGVPGTATVGSFLNTTSVLSSNGVPAAPAATAFVTIVPQDIFADGFED